MIEKLTIFEVLLASFFGIACFWGPTEPTASGRRLVALLARTSMRLEGLRRSRWQWLTMVGTMLSLRIQNLLPPAVEATVGLMFVILLVSPVVELARAKK